MQQTPLQTESLAIPQTAARKDRFIYIAVPWSPAGVGMFKVAWYLIRAQADKTAELAATVLVFGRGPRRVVTDRLGVHATKVAIVISGGPAPVEAAGRKIAADGTRRVLFVGRLTPLTGVDDLLEALAKAEFDRGKVE